MVPSGPEPMTPHQTWLEVTMCWFSSLTGNSRPISSAVACSGDNVPLVRMMDLAPSLANRLMLKPGLKHQRWRRMFSLLLLRNPFPPSDF